MSYSSAPLSGWGRTNVSVGHVVRPQSLDELRSIIAGAGPRGLIVRGLGRSYGDPAQNAGGTVVDLTSWDRVLDLDTTGPRLRVQAGASLAKLLKGLVTRDLWMPVVPGTHHVTIGGAIAADVHGKNHHVAGSFGHHLTALSILLTSGDLVEATPTGAYADLFWATVAGMGLTGVVIEATLELTPIDTPHVVVSTRRTPGLGKLLDALASDSDSTYNVAWFDAASTGPALGRGVVTSARPATRDEVVGVETGASGLHWPSVGVTPPVNLVNPWTARAFNRWQYTRAARRPRIGDVRPLEGFLNPLDAVDGWNRLYGPRGFCQYQFVVPFSAESSLTEALRLLGESGHVSSINVLKRLGSSNQAPLSFPMPGWTVTVDLPVRPGLSALLSRLDSVVVSSSGRLYLAKDARTDAETIERMYPRLDEFRTTRDRYDPHRRLRSDLSRRLEL